MSDPVASLFSGGVFAAQAEGELKFSIPGEGEMLKKNVDNVHFVSTDQWGQADHL